MLKEEVDEEDVAEVVARWTGVPVSRESIARWERVSLLAVPASFVVTMLIIRRSQRLFVAQGASTGALNGHVEEMHTGHAIVKAFGRQHEAIATFEAENERLRRELDQAHASVRGAVEETHKQYRRDLVPVNQAVVLYGQQRRIFDRD